MSKHTPPDTYPAPVDGWVCFHCGKRFLDEKSGCKHFGETPIGMPQCFEILAERDRLKAVNADLLKAPYDASFYYAEDRGDEYREALAAISKAEGERLHTMLAVETRPEEQSPHHRRKRECNREVKRTYGRRAPWFVSEVSETTR